MYSNLGNELSIYITSLRHKYETLSIFTHLNSTVHIKERTFPSAFGPSGIHISIIVTV